MANIELRLYQYFVALCEEQNFSRAAERLAISPPTLTHQIQKLERNLSVRLLNRKTKKRLQLTEAGVRFLESARDVLHRADEAEIAARKASRGEVGRLEIGYMIATVYSGMVQRYVGDFQKAYPAVDITMRQMSTVGLISAILANEMDAGFARLPKQYPSGVSGVLLYRTPVILALPSTHPLARKRGPVDSNDLTDEAFVTTSVGYDLAFTRNVESIGSLGGFAPNIRKRAEDLTTVLTYVSAGYGIAAVSQEMANWRIPNVTFKKLAPPSAPEVAFSFMYRTNETAPASKAFIEMIRSYVQRDDAERRN
jgi:DNA-binding transcriptional LysR family regulator